jgi:metal-sulfur cluster biosynthetic enzyme
MKKEIIKKLKEIIDPHIGINIYDMELIKKITVKKDSVEISFKPTSPYCPMIHFFTEEIEKKVKQVKGVKKVKIKIEN